MSDFYLFEILAALRLRMTVRTARHLLAGMYVLAVPLVFIVAMASFSLIRPIAEEKGVQAEELLVALAMLSFYATTTYALREAFSQRRFMVAGSPNAELFRAMDISSREVFLVYCARRICGYHLLLGMVPAGFLFAYWPVPDTSIPHLVFAAVVPVGMCAVSLSVAARSALSLRQGRSRESVRALATCVGSLALGISAALFIAAPLMGSSDVRMPGLYSSALAGSCATVVLVVGGTASFRLVRDLGRMPFHSFPLAAASRPGASTPSDTRAGTRPPALAAILVRELRGSAVYPLVKQVFLAGAGGVAAIAGFALASPFPLPMANLPAHAYEMAAGAVAVMVLGLAEMLSRAIGPTTLRAMLRTTWEAGMSSWYIARALVLVWTTCGLCVGVTTAAVVLLLAGPSLTAIPVIMAVCGVSAALVAETVATPPRNTDGSAASDPIAGFLALVLTGPVVWILGQEWMVGPALAFCYALILTGVATACVRRSILKLR
ncbi:hypothetical protein [Streptomyces sp. NBC_01481]|uniref:hypothetical protein n=1 Tax=Streptomyces sp. NBC_01481 TaxID=2975869 RepID=UPI00225092DB|nr:hypothetical protein [Streptomyces sp. NBC_01481]MCX4584519.1 hypothetical protein [Streptomyces sp. NBC_01481]